MIHFLGYNTRQMLVWSQDLNTLIQHLSHGYDTSSNQACHAKRIAQIRPNTLWNDTLLWPAQILPDASFIANSWIPLSQHYSHGHITTLGRSISAKGRAHSCQMVLAGHTLVYFCRSWNSYSPQHIHINFKRFSFLSQIRVHLKGNFPLNIYIFTFGDLVSLNIY